MEFLSKNKISENENYSAVYMTQDISSKGLMLIYKALNRTADGKTAVKISSGEPGGHNFLSAAMIAPLVKEVNGTIVEL